MKEWTAVNRTGGHPTGWSVNTGTAFPIARDLTEAEARLIAAANELKAVAEETKEYLELKLIGFRREYPENHAMIHTAQRLLTNCNKALDKVKGVGG